MKTAYDVIVLGLGAMGSAALYQLSQRGVSVLGIDRYAPPHTHGSSHGDTRITRQAIGEGHAYTPLALRSQEIWRELEQQTGEVLFVASGGLILGNPDGGTGIHGKATFFETTLEAAQQYGIAHDVLSPTEIRRRFPPFQVRDFEVGYHEPGAGYLRPERCVAAQLMLAQARGAAVHTHETVQGYDLVGDRVRVRTDRGEYEAGRLIVSAGPWVADLLDEAQKPLFSVYRQTLYWFDVAAQHEQFTDDRFPVFIWDCGVPGDEIYGFPAVDGRGGGIKVGAEQYRVTTTSDGVERAVSPEETQAMYAGRVQPYLRGVGGKCVRTVTCLYTVTPDFNFVLDFHPRWPQVVVASPCSGHGFKHSAAIGEALAEMVTQGRSRLDLSSFRWDRFAE